MDPDYYESGLADLTNRLFGRIMDSTELTLPEFTKALCFRHGKFRVNQDGSFGYMLDDLERKVATQFTRKNKERGARITRLLVECSLNKLTVGPVHKIWKTEYIATEYEFLNIFFREILQRGNRLLVQDRARKVHGKTYTASGLTGQMNRALKGEQVPEHPRIHRIVQMAEEVRYHMISHHRRAFGGNNKSIVAMINARVKESTSENEKNAAKWIREEKLRRRIERYDSMPQNARQVLEAGIGPAQIVSDFELYNRLKQKEPNNPKMYRNRLLELREMYYEAKDIYGILFAYSQHIPDQGPHFICEMIDQNPFFMADCTPEHWDDHRLDPGKPHEVQFPVFMDKQALVKICAKSGICFDDWYIPDPIEVLVTALPDMVHKFASPELSEREYKYQRLEEIRHEESFNLLLQYLNSISPVRGNVSQESRLMHVENLKKALLGVFSDRDAQIYRTLRDLCCYQ